MARTLPTLITASKWEGVYAQAWARVRARGLVTASNGERVPALTNEEAVALIAAWYAAAPYWRLWYPYAAVAYGYEPGNDNRLDTSSSRAHRRYRSADIAAALWTSLRRVAVQMDDDRRPVPSADLSTRFDDPIFTTKVAVALNEDGNSVEVGLPKRPKIPSGFCIDKRTGKRRLIRVKCPQDASKDAGGQWRYRDPITGVDMPCDQQGDCEPEVIDPVGLLAKELLPLALVVGAVWWLAKRKPRRQRRN